MRTTHLGSLLTVIALGVGCGQKTSSPIAETSSPEASATSSDVAKPSSQAAFKAVPVQSAELTGVWYGVTRDTGVVIQFIGRQSRTEDVRGVLSGKWVVHVERGSISSATEFVDNVDSGAVDIEVGMVRSRTEETFTASLGRVERSSNGGLYLSIYKNTSSDMYVPTERIRLQHVTGAGEIKPAIIEKMRAARESLQAA